MRKFILRRLVSQPTNAQKSNTAIWVDSVCGDDRNLGTQDSPLRTPQEALERLRCALPPILEKGAESVAHLTESFHSYVKIWRNETADVSSKSKMLSHPAYQAIIALGAEAVPLLLGELAARPDHWGAALRAITNENPVPADVAGNLPRIAEAWVGWGKSRGFVF